MLHNGRPIMLRGVNRHEFDPWRGKAITEEGMVRRGKRGGGEAREWVGGESCTLRYGRGGWRQ